MAKGGRPRYGFLVTAFSTSTKDPAQILRTAVAKRKEGAAVTIYLVGDGVYLARKGQGNATSSILEEAVSAGARLIVSDDHWKASGMPAGSLLEGAELVERSCKDLVERVMEEWDKVVVV